MEFLEIGKTHKTHGLKGALKASFEAFFLPQLEHLRLVYIDCESSFLPYFIRRIEFFKDDSGIVFFEDIEDVEMARALKNKALFVDRNQYPEVETDINSETLLGYEAVTTDLPLGTIEEIIENPWQDLASVAFNSAEMLIPIHKDWIVSIDESSKTVVFKLPDGFLELYQ